ncbi:hypothetical protein A1O7_01537 [Cladophialophora yegresii CBS 114405]|uniref:DUF7587 domain-containing protein n=1 Tax=Cladophialophora yegresii CBS 114405 TaxID=1182544 RepID=W9WAQ6_9EURO|nr:uncharacterized protein A1O7_01537 [Cladophialophora yegresii CBS 114405]EXJ65197.1 hypothetical protein A1O7_01537 [Cladophialophora yegresii CBS 114405]
MPPPGYTTDEFRDLARRHLCEDKTFASPFLSLTQNPARALNIIATDERTRRGLAIVDYNDLEEKIKQTFGEEDGLWLVPDVYDAHKLNNLTRIHDDRSAKPKPGNQKDYTGTGEFLAWAAVEIEPIAILHHREALRLYTMLSPGNSLNKVRDIYRGVVAYQLLRSFKVDGYLQGSRGANFDEFIRGIYGERRQLDQIAPSPLLPCNEKDWADVPTDDTASIQSKPSTKTRQSYVLVKKAKITVEIPSKTSKSFLLSKSISSSDSTRVQQQEDSRQLNQPADTGIQHGDTDEEAEKTEQVTQNSDVTRQSSPCPEMDFFMEELLEHANIPSPTPPPPRPPVAATPKRQLSTVFPGSPAGAVPIKASAMTAIDLTVEDDNDGGRHNAASRRQKVRAPETSSEVTQVRPTTRTTAKAKAKAPTAAAFHQSKQTNIQNHFGRIAKSSGRPSKFLAGRKRYYQEDDKEEEDDIGDGDDDLQIISETTRKIHRQSYLRTTTRMQPATVLTVRSRSLSESINVSNK